MDFRLMFIVINLILLSFSATPGLTRLVESRDTATWEEAKTKCQQNGQLATFIDIYSQNELPLGEFWFSGVQALSPWVWMRGCFNKTFLKKGPADELVHSAGTCAIKCYNSPYFALDVFQLCYCLSETDVQTNLNQSMKISVRHCKQCGNDTCGGEDGESVFLYKKYENNTPPFKNMGQESDKNLRCVTMNYTISNQENFSESFLITDCNEKHTGICTTIDGLTRIFLPMTWFAIMQHCQERSISPVVVENARQRLFQPVDRFWIGLYREDATIYDDKSIITGNLSITNCLYLKNTDSLTEMNLKSDCNVRRKYICRISDERTTMSIASTDVHTQEITQIYVEDSSRPKRSIDLNTNALVGVCVGAITLIILFVIVLVFF